MGWKQCSGIQLLMVLTSGNSCPLASPSSLMGAEGAAWEAKVSVSVELAV